MSFCGVCFNSVYVMDLIIPAVIQLDFCMFILTITKDNVNGEACFV